MSSNSRSADSTIHISKSCSLQKIDQCFEKYYIHAYIINTQSLPQLPLLLQDSKPEDTILGSRPRSSIKGICSASRPINQPAVYPQIRLNHSESIARSSTDKRFFADRAARRSPAIDRWINKPRGWERVYSHSQPQGPPSALHVGVMCTHRREQGS